MNNINKALLGAFLFLLCTQALAVPLTNGDFSTTDGWVDASFTGSAYILNGEGVIESGPNDDPFSGVFVQGDDGFFSFVIPIILDAADDTLSFYTRFESLGADTTESGLSSFTDYLSVVIYDALALVPDTAFDLGIDSSVTTMTLFNIDVSLYSGRDVALSFELSDQDDGRNSRVYLDDVSFQQGAIIASNPVPEPETLALFGLGILSLIATRTKRRKI